MDAFYRILPLVAIAMDLGIGLYVFTRDPKHASNRLFLCITVALSFWGFGEFWMRNAHSASVAMLGGKIGSVGWCLIGAFFIHFSVVLTETHRHRARYLLVDITYALGIAFLVITWSSNLIFSSFVKSQDSGFTDAGGFLRMPSKLFVLATLLVGVAILVVYYVTSATGEKKVRIGFVIIAALFPIITGIMVDILLPLFGIHSPLSSQAAGPVMVVIMGYAVTRHDLMKPVVSRLDSTFLTNIKDSVLIVDAEGLIESANLAATRQTDYTGHELKGMKVTNLLFENLSRGSHLQPADLWSDAERRLFCRSKTGIGIPVATSISPVFTNSGKRLGSILVLHDMREAIRIIEAEQEAKVAGAEVEVERRRLETLRRSHEELEEASKFLEDVIDNLVEPIFIKDADLRCVFVNKALCETAGFSREELVGKTSEELIPVEFAGTSTEIEQEILITGMSTEYEVNDIVDPYGKQRNIKLVKSPIIGDSGEVEFIVGLVQDTTEHRRLDKARLDFIRIAAHELRTPLTSMKLGFELLARETRGSLNADQQRSFDILSISIERLSSLAKNLLDLASLDAGVLTMNQQTVALVPLMDEAVALFSSTIGEKELYCKVEVADEIRNAHADPGRISQVLYNLVSNAVKYTSEGGITLSARDPGDGFLEVCVSDTGTGISASHCKSIFTSFVKAQDSETAREGTGLGLSITKAIVEAHGGNIWVESTPGAGSSFYFTVLVEGSERI